VTLDVSPDSTTLTVGGGQQQITATVKNTGNDAASDVPVKIEVPLSDQQVTVTNRPNECQQSGNTLNCKIETLAPGATVNLSFRVLPPGQSSIPAGQQRQGEGQVSAAGTGASSPSFTIVLKAAVAPTTAAAGVTEISGLVNDSAGGISAPLKDAIVRMTDAAGKAREAKTDAKGKFKFTSTGGDGPIPPGTVTISASKDGYEDSTPINRDAKSGQSITNIQIPLKASAAASAGAVQPSADPGSSGPAAVDTGGAQPGSNTSGGSGLFSWVLIVLGGLLVLLGIGAIVLLLRRRNDDDDEPEDDPTAPRRGPPGGAPAPAPVYRGAPDPTMIAGAPMGAPAMAGHSNANDATAIVRAPHLPPDDPYGAPAAPRTQMYPAAAPASPPGYGPAGGPGGSGYGGGNAGGYGPNSGGYGPPGYGPSSRPAADGYSASDYDAGGYGAGPAGRPSSGGGYNDYSERGGYGDESTRRYEPGGYSAGAQSGGYGGAPAQPGGYGPGGSDPGYGGGGPSGPGAGPGSGPGYGRANGYEPEPYGGGANGYVPPPANNGYVPGGGGGAYGPAGDPYAPGAPGGDPYGAGGPPGDYEARGGYGPASGYDREPARGGYGPPQDYDERGGRRGDDRGGRRPLDWLDD
jgi:hypothetical protein